MTSGVDVSDLTKIREGKKESDDAMLESNTDRSYFMIGAVIVAALLIGLVVWMFRAPDTGPNGQPIPGTGGFVREAITQNLETVTDGADGILADIDFN